ncbi:hypothetical protein [uncultured Paraglaciecola sp.]|mgnify:CR=1 FL=1|uniref:hypothetical protein n=1 Tax=uncultured Paraglaciecola sp. TaxID=1765024 RepID=UPI002636D209|nr:hypothetical protein [uncultured Paraglaciecola sp.]
MTDQLKAIPFNTGLNEVVSDLNAQAGDVRRSLNYALQAEGGYEWIGGLSGWAGKSISLNLDAIDILEVETFSPPPPESDLESQYGVKSTYIGKITRQNTSIVILEKHRATEQFRFGGYFGDKVPETTNVLDINPVLTDFELSQAKELIDNFGSNSAPRPSGNGEIFLLHENANYLYSVRQRGVDKAVVSRSINGVGGWVELGEIQLSASDIDKGIRWEAYSYTFAGQNPTLFIVNGITSAYRVEYASNEPPIAVIDDGVAQFPTHVIVHQNHLFLSYPGGRILHSNLGDPVNFTALGGAAELSTGDEITGFQILPGDSLGIFCRDRIRILQGTSAADWVLQDYSDESGAIVGTIQNMPTSIFADKRGVTTLASSDAYGSFKDKALTQRIDSLYQTIRQNAKLYSAVSRSRSQYRLINEDGRGLYFTFKGSSLAGVMEVDLGLPITAMATLRGDEDQVFVAYDGAVYQMDYPVSLEGDETIEAFIELVDHHYGNPRQKKRFSQIDVDVVGDPQVTLEVANLIDGGKDYYEDNVPVSIDTLSRSKSSYRQELLSRYSQRFEGTAYLCGSGVSQSIRITHKSNHAHSIKSATVHYRSRGQKR